MLGFAHILSLDGDNIVVVSTFKDLGQGRHVYAERHSTVTAEVLESFGLELHGYERDVGRVHRL